MHTSTSTFLIVGDRFVGFAVHDGVVTLSQFRDLLKLGIESVDGLLTAIPGQGVSVTDWEALQSHVGSLGLNGYVEFRDPQAKNLASAAEAHKKVEANTLIADLRQSGVGVFEASLRLHNSNELLLDHQTGQHVQGMVAVEAARQMFLAVSERFYASRFPEKKYYYVIESMNTDFENFLFPVDATVEFRTVVAEIGDPSRLTFNAKISISQAGRRASSTRVSYTAFDSPVIEAKEHKRARRAVDYQVTGPVLELSPAA